MQVVNFIADNWEAIAAASFVALNVLNALSPHFSNFSGVRKFVLVVSEILSVLASADSPKVLKAPGKLS